MVILTGPWAARHVTFDVTSRADVHPGRTVVSIAPQVVGFPSMEQQ